MTKAPEGQYFVIISAGGTGGHMSPASALASDLILRGYRVELITDPRGAKYDKMFEGIPTHIVKSGTAGAGIKGKIKGAANLAIGFVQAHALIGKKRPDMVVGFGGYPSVPGVWAAQRKDIPTILHEQNAIIGKANAFLAPKAERIALSTPNMTGLEKDEQLRSVITGNPVRPEISALKEAEYNVPTQTGDLNILIMGGSLGASVFSEIVPQTLAQLSDEYKKRLKIVQQCREAELENVRKTYVAAGINATLAPFIDNVGEEIAKAHLFIGRSGVSTTAEISIAGIPAIYVPYPHHKDQQQKKNADWIADHGGAWVMVESGFTCEALLERIQTIMQNTEILTRAAEKAKECGKPDAAKKLGNLVSAIIEEDTE